MGTPDSEVDIDENLVRRLIATQVPELAEAPIKMVANGWDNVTVRIGDHHAARLPRREVAVDLIRNEQRWLATIQDMIEVPIPVPIHHGSAGHGYPWPWSVVPWLDGTTAEHDPLKSTQAEVFGGFLAALHRPTPTDAPHNRFRGTPLADHADGVHSRWNEFRSHEGLADLCTPALAIWDAGMEAPGASVFVWGHGDLHPRNVVSIGGALNGVLDWGDINGGDPATDLASVWMQFDPNFHSDVWDAYGPADTATRHRARAWAIGFAGMLIGTGLDDDPGFLRLGKTIAARAIEAA